MTKVELKTVSELLDKKFVVPLYQRGYRWEAQQVKDLLEDIDGFMNNRKTHERDVKHAGFDKSVSDKTDEYYCLQPLAVKETVERKEDFLNQLPKSIDVDVLLATRNAIDNSVCWEVIDGQQRLTTIFIILQYLGKLNCFQIQFERWKNKVVNGAANTNSLSKEVSEIADQLKQDPNYQRGDSVDLWHVCNAYKEIVRYFGNGQSCGFDRSSKEFQAQFLDTLLNKVQFIWYESDEEDPVKVFTRLNIGKIALTNSELIKALFLNRSNFAGADFDKIRLRQTEIAVRWDEIETTLQNDEFWMFFHSPGFDKPTRIDFIFELVCNMGLLDAEQDCDFLDHKDERLGKDQYQAFRYFNEYFHSKKAAEKASNCHATIIEQCWKTIDSVFATFREWFDDLKFYHYVGFLAACGYEVKDILTSWREGSSKESFIDWLKREIKIAIANCKNLGQSYGFNVGDPPRTQCRRLLLLHNIQSVIIQNAAETIKYDVAAFYKFPFHLYKIEVWNVEHVDSNTENRLDTHKDKAEWLKSAWCFLPEGVEVVDIKRQILRWVNQRDNNDDSKSFEDLHDKILTLVRKGSALGEKNKNTIENFVLLDETTNKSYGNAIFPVKKMILMGKMQGVQYEFIEIKDHNGDLSGFKAIPKQLDGKEGVKWKTAFVPPVTQRVFLKAFNPVSSNPWSWDADDAKAYQNNIYETLKEFGVTIPKEENGHE